MDDKAKKYNCKHDNPIDNVINETLPSVREYFHKLGFSANGITYLSIVFGILSAYFLYNKNYIYSAVCYAISYYFDCLDGNYARFYNDKSVLGDYLDHYSDFVINGIILYIMVFKIGIDKKIISFIVAMMIMMYINSSLQEKYYNTDEKSKSMGDFVFDIGINKEYIEYTRYFGCGTFIFVMVCIIANLDVLVKDIK